MSFGTHLPSLGSYRLFSHERIDDLTFTSDEPQLTPRERDLPSIVSLDVLAEVAGQEIKLLAEEDPYQVFWKIAHEIDGEGDFIADFIADTIGIDLIRYSSESTQLKTVISPEEIQVLASAMEWVCLLSFGSLPERKNIQSVKNFLGVSYLSELLTPSIGPFQGESRWSLADFLAFIDNPHHFITNEGVAQEISKKLIEKVSDVVISDEILSSINIYINHNLDESYFQQLQTIFDQTDLQSRIRWGLFVSVVYEEKGGLTAHPGQWPSNISSDLIPLLEKIDQEVYQSRLIKVTKPIIAPINALKLKVPQLPNWMPNGGNSCYISSSLWGLFFLANQKIQEKIQYFQMLGADTSDLPLLQKARLEFITLYNALALKEIKQITLQDVNNFRLSVEQAFPKVFLSPNQKTQEDAFEFLAVICSLLDLEFCAADAPKFHKIHAFTRADATPLLMPESYDYQAALQLTSTPEPLSLIDIRLDESKDQIQSLKALVTQVRSTDTVERNAYKKTPDIEGPKYQSVMTNHTEQFVVESKDKAPEYFIGRLARFSLDYAQGIRKKLFHTVLPNATLEFHIPGTDGQTVSYDLSAIAVHQGEDIESGHYYTYFMTPTLDEWKIYKYDDIRGQEDCIEIEEVIADVASNGYIYFYKKREEGALPPPLLPMESEFEEGHQDKPIPVAAGEEFTPSSVSDELKKKSLKRSLDTMKEGSTPVEKLQEDAQLQGIISPLKLDCAEAKAWMSHHLNLEFTLDERGYSSLEDLLLLHYQFAANPEQTKRFTSKEREFLLAAARFLESPIYLIEPSRDYELEIVDSSFIFPSENFRHGEDFLNPPIYLYKQSNHTFFVLNKID